MSLGWPKVILPPQTDFIQPLADEMFISGVPTKITNFKTRLSVRQVLNYYRNRWATDFSENEFGSWQQISRFNEKYFITIQVKDAEDIKNSFITTGRLNISNVDETAIKKAKVFPMLEGSQLINDIQTRDKNKVARTLLFLNHYSSSENAEYYQKFYQEREWSKVMARQIEINKYMFVFKKDEDEVTIAVDPQEVGSSVLINEVKKKLFFN